MASRLGLLERRFESRSNMQDDRFVRVESSVRDVSRSAAWLDVLSIDSASKAWVLAVLLGCIMACICTFILVRVAVPSRSTDPTTRRAISSQPSAYKSYLNHSAETMAQGASV
ncbi:hypothetical protein [Luteibacter aegosomatissinici]|uniref:hypothetical protein n=1 Tax=Luteibacter aegosomatissinici TaxID=2911539 RepID=UPI001FFA7029|nr:hypothetical protein [Luteibacter aegosomatissinici]UPG93719.1 hypothetical protein L2Y97_18030 [Luteibacter aegosomatissinici]